MSALTLPESYQPNVETIAAFSCLDRLYRLPLETMVPGAPEGISAPFSFLAHSTRECAFHDGVFAPHASKIPRQRLTTSDLEGLCYCELRLAIDLSIATLHHPDRMRLEHLAIDAAEDAAGDPNYWVNRLYHRCPDIHGVMWTSRHCDPDITVAIFPARVPLNALVLVDPPRFVLEHESLQSDMKRFALRAGIEIDLSNVQ